MNVILLGGTRGIGRAVGRRLALRGDRLFLLGRGGLERADALPRSAHDLEAQSPGGQTVGVAHCDLADRSSFAPALEAAWGSLGQVDAVVVTAGLYEAQDRMESDPERFAAIADVNFTGTIVFCEAVRSRLLAEGGGRLCVIGSVAGDRARKPVSLYGATKAGLAHYLEGLDLRYAQQGLRVITVKPGFVRTGMTAGLPEPPFAAEVDDAARAVVRAIDRGSRVAYAPPVWRWIMAVIRWLPRFVLRRTSF